MEIEGHNRRMRAGLGRTLCYFFQQGSMAKMEPVKKTEGNRPPGIVHVLNLEKAFDAAELPPGAAR
jgi:hypothetical protein